MMVGVSVLEKVQALIDTVISGLSTSDSKGLAFVFISVQDAHDAWSN